MRPLWIALAVMLVFGLAAPSAQAAKPRLTQEELLVKSYFDFMGFGVGGGPTQMREEIQRLTARFREIKGLPVSVALDDEVIRLVKQEAFTAPDQRTFSPDRVPAGYPAALAADGGEPSRGAPAPAPAVSASEPPPVPPSESIAEQRQRVVDAATAQPGGDVDALADALQGLMASVDAAQGSAPSSAASSGAPVQESPFEALARRQEAARRARFDQSQVDQLVTAIRNGGTDYVRDAIARGVPLDIPSSRDGLLPIQAAATRPEIRTMLLAAGADPAVATESGATLLHQAAKSGSAEDVRALIAAGVDLSARDDRGRTPLHGAAERDNAAAIEALIAAGADPDAQDAASDTALHIAAAGEKLEALAQLLRSGADATVRDSRGRTPIDATFATHASTKVVALIASSGNVPAETYAFASCAQLEFLKTVPDLSALSRFSSTRTVFAIDLIGLCELDTSGTATTLHCGGSEPREASPLMFERAFRASQNGYEGLLQRCAGSSAPEDSVRGTLGSSVAGGLTERASVIDVRRDYDLGDGLNARLGVRAEWSYPRPLRYARRVEIFRAPPVEARVTTTSVCEDLAAAGFAELVPAGAGCAEPPTSYCGVACLDGAFLRMADLAARERRKRPFSELDPTPFAELSGGAYLQAIYSGDFEAVEAMDAAYRATQTGLLEGADRFAPLVELLAAANRARIDWREYNRRMRDAISLSMAAVTTYVTRYQDYSGRCLRPATAHTITKVTSYYTVWNENNGIGPEVARTLDDRTEEPITVNVEFAHVVDAVGLGEPDAPHVRVYERLNGGASVSPNINEVATGTVQMLERFDCEAPEILHMEDQLLEYFSIWEQRKQYANEVVELL